MTSSVKTTYILETDHDGKQAFLVILDKNNDQAEQVSSQVMQPVMQRKVDVTWQHSENNVEIAYYGLKLKLIR